MVRSIASLNALFIGSLTFHVGLNTRIVHNRHPLPHVGGLPSPLASDTVVRAYTRACRSTPVRRLGIERTHRSPRRS